MVTTRAAGMPVYIAKTSDLLQVDIVHTRSVPLIFYRQPGPDPHPGEQGPPAVTISRRIALNPI